MNRYSAFVLILIATMTLFIVFDVDDDSTEITGYAENITEKENGNTFTIIAPDGERINAFSKIDIDGSLHIFKGRFSNDGKMFFVDHID